MIVYVNVVFTRCALLELFLAFIVIMTDRTINANIMIFSFMHFIVRSCCTAFD